MAPNAQGELTDAEVFGGGSSAPPPMPRELSDAEVFGSPTPKPPFGPIRPGNIDLNNRPVVKNPDGSVSTVRTIGVGTDKGEVNIPTVVGGKIVSNPEAIAHYQQTGENLGTYGTPMAAEAYARQLHDQQAEQYAPPPPRPSFGTRLFNNATEAFQGGTLTGALTNLFDKAHESAVVDLLNKWGYTPNAVDAKQKMEASRQAPHQAYEAMPSFTTAPDLGTKITEGATSLIGQLAGGMASPESFATLPGKASALVERGVGALVKNQVAKKVITRGVEQGAINFETDPAVQELNVAAGARDHWDPVQTALAGPLGFLMGATTAAPEAAKGLANVFRTWRGRQGAKVAPDVAPTAPEIDAFTASPEMQAFLQANGITDPKDPRVVQLEDRLAARRTAEAQRGAPQEQGGPTGKFKQDQQRQVMARDVAAQAQPIEETGGAVVDNAQHPAALADVGRVEPQRLPEILPVDSQGRADTGDLGVRAGVGAAEKTAVGVRQNADEAFRLAELQRSRAGGLDTQSAGRPEGSDQQNVTLDEGFPVQVLSRRMETVKGRHVEMAQVHRYDPRTGALDPEAVPYDVPVNQLKTARYAQVPRMAQDFEARAKGPPPPEQPRMADEAVRREPNQTYRTTAAQPNEDWPGASSARGEAPPEGGPAPGPGPHEGRSPFPDQSQTPPPNKGSFRARATREEEVVQEFARRQREEAARKARGETASPSSKTRPGDNNASTTAKPLGPDGRFEVDDRGFVLSDKGGPVRFADQKQTAKWIINRGHKLSFTQIFEIENHPSGKGFTVHERGRTEGATSGDAGSSAGQSSAEPPRGAGSAESRPEPGSQPPHKLTETRTTQNDGTIRTQYTDANGADVGYSVHDPKTETVNTIRVNEARRRQGFGEQILRRLIASGEVRKGTAGSYEAFKLNEKVGRNVGGNKFEYGDAPHRPEQDISSTPEINPQQSARKAAEAHDADVHANFNQAASNLRNKFYSNPLGDPEVWKELGNMLKSSAGWIGDEAKHFAKYLSDAMDKFRTSNVRNKLEAIRTISDSTDGRLRATAIRYKSPTIMKIADMFHALAGAVGKAATGEDYHSAYRRNVSMRMNELDKLLDPLKALKGVDRLQAMEQVGNLIRNPRSIRPGTPIHDAAAGIGKIYKDTLAYMREAGVPVGEVKDGYLTRMENVEKILTDTEGFRAAAKRAYMADGVSAKDATVAADEWLQRLLVGDHGIKADGNDFVKIGSGTGQPQFTKGRVLSKRADEIMKDYYHGNPADILPRYITRAVKRTEWARRMGPQLEKWKEMKQAMLDEKAGDAIPGVVKDILANIGEFGKSAGDDGAAGFRNFIRTWATLKLMTRSLYSSVSEPFVIGIRTGNPVDSLRAFATTIQHWVPVLHKTEGAEALHSLAEDLGYVGDAIDRLVTMQRSYGMAEGDLGRETQSDFFKAIGLTQLTDASRVAGMSIGNRFIYRQSKNLLEGRRATLAKNFLSEMGVPEAKHQAFASWVKDRWEGGGPNLSDIIEGGEMGKFHHVAVGRFIDQSIQVPTNATRPRYASHPWGSLFYNLMSFTYAFQKNVLNRSAKMAWHGASKDGLTLGERFRYAMPLAMLMPLVVINYGFNNIRDLLTTDPARQGQKPKSEPQKWLLAIERANVNGITDMPLNTLNLGLRYTRDPADAFLGAPLSNLSESFGALEDLWGSDNSPDTNTTERKAWRAIWDAGVMPALEVGGMALGNAAGGAVGQALSTAAVYGVSHPALREAVVGKVAGPPRPPRGQGGSGYNLGHSSGHSSGHRLGH